MTRRTFYSFLFSVLLLIPLTLHADALAENQARLGAITGDVGLLSQGAKEWIEPHEGLPLESGDRIRTGDDGRVEIAFSENTFCILEPESELVTEHMETNTGRFNLVAGAVGGRVDSARAAGTMQSWEFNTPLFVATVRGTEFAVSFSTGDGARLGVFEGIVELEPAETAAGRQPPIRVSGGQEAFMRRGKPAKLQKGWSPTMKALAIKRAALLRRQTVIQNTWSPFTPAVKTESRLKFVAPPSPKKKKK